MSKGLSQMRFRGPVDDIVKTPCRSVGGYPIKAPAQEVIWPLRTPRAIYRSPGESTGIIRGLSVKKSS
jgi:hypothetical protein